MIGLADSIAAVLLGAPLGIFAIYISITGYLGFTAEYKIDENGIKAKYLYGPENYIPWDEFQQVCVCYGKQNKAGAAAVYICCVKKGEKKNFFGRWKANDPLHYRTVITMYYTDELYEEIKEKCPYQVPDLRKNRAYRL